ncbi:MAG: hypothetical protein KC486_09515 [Myxococcales bacterium]|nr:hypothetical protein [Myxococcales bacterium]
MRRARDLVVTILLSAPVVVASSACGPKSPGDEEPAVVSVAPGGGAAQPEPVAPALEGKAAPAELEANAGEGKAASSVYSTRTAPAYADEKAAPAEVETIAPASDAKLVVSDSKRVDDGKSATDGDSKESAPPAYDGKAAPAEEARDDERPKGAHAVPVARRDDLGKPGQGKPLAAVAAFVAAVDESNREAAAALMTEGCVERERSWDKSFTKAIFDRGLRFHIIKLRDESIEGDRASVRLGVVFLDSAGEPDNEGMSFTLVKREGVWWIDEIR